MSERSPSNNNLEVFSFDEVERIVAKNIPREEKEKLIVQYMNGLFAVIQGTNPIYVQKTIKLNFPLHIKRKLIEVPEKRSVPRTRVQTEESNYENEYSDDELMSLQSKSSNSSSRSRRSKKEKEESSDSDEEEDSSENSEENSVISIHPSLVNVPEGATTDIEYIFRTDRGFKAAMANKRITLRSSMKVTTRNKTKIVEEEEIMSLYDLWTKSKYRKEFDRMSFTHHNDPRSFNLYHGLAIDNEDISKYKAEDADPWIQHIREIWCRGDENSFVWIIKMLARLVQYPFNKSGVAIVLKGRQGCGKGIILEKLRHIFGSYFKSLRPNEFLGDFNAVLADTLILFLDESVWSGDRRTAAALKTLITEPKMQINQKNLPAFTIENNLNFFMATNYQQAAPVEEGDRRYYCLNCDKRYAGKGTPENIAYFKKIANVPYQSVYKFLMSIDIDDFEPTIYPTTNAIREQKIYGMDTVTGWVYHSIVEEKVWIRLGSIMGKVLYEEYVNYVKHLGGHYGRPIRYENWQDKLFECTGIRKDTKTKNMLEIPSVGEIKSQMRDLMNDDTFPGLEDEDADNEEKKVEKNSKVEEDNEEEENSEVEDSKEEKKKKNAKKILGEPKKKGTKLVTPLRRVVPKKTILD